MFTMEYIAIVMLNTLCAQHSVILSVIVNERILFVHIDHGPVTFLNARDWEKVRCLFTRIVCAIHHSVM